MRQLIEDMISKGFYQTKKRVPTPEKGIQERANEEGTENPEKDVEATPVQKPAIRLDEESG